MNPSAESGNRLDPTIAIWAESICGDTLRSARRLTGGNRRQSWILRFQDSADPVFLRLDPSPTETPADVFTLRRESRCYRALGRGGGVRIPQLLAAHDTREAVLLECVCGSSEYHYLTVESERVAVAHDLIVAVAELHRLDPAGLGFPGLPASAPIRDHIAHHLRHWADAYRYSGRRDPLIDFALAWLERSIPPADEPARVVHGDLGPGNFMFEDGRVTALIDWELTHLGDPLEDLAWLSMRSVFAPFPDFGELLRVYEEVSGRAVDPVRLRYHRVFVHWCVTVIRHLGLGDSDPSGDIGVGLLSRVVNRRLLVESLADAAGVDLRPVAPADAAEAGPREWLYDAALSTIRTHLAPAIADAEARNRSRGVSRVLKYLRDDERLAPAHRERERLGLTRLLDLPVDTSIDEARTALLRHMERHDIVGDSRGLERMLNHFAMIVGDETDAQRSGLGALADRHLPAL